MNNQNKREILDDILLDTDRVESLNGLISEIADKLASSECYIATQLYSLSYCSDLLIKSINEKINTLYPNLFNESDNK